MGVYLIYLEEEKVILVSAVIFAVGALWSGLATDLTSLVFSRLFLGIAIGVASFTVPLYIAEIAPAKSRGTSGFNVSVNGYNRYFTFIHVRYLLG